MALLLAWLHQALVNEVLVLETTLVDPDRYCEALDQIFDKKLAQALKQRVELEIKFQNDGEFTQTFELFYLLMVFKI